MSEAAGPERVTSAEEIEVSVRERPGLKDRGMVRAVFRGCL